MRRGYMSASKILAELGEAATRAAKDALKDGAESVMEEAKRRCPVYDGRNPHVVKGALRDSIHMTARRGGASYRIIADAQAKDGLFYGTIVEYSPHAGRPFLWPSLDAKRDEVRTAIADAVRAACRRKGT